MVRHLRGKVFYGLKIKPPLFMTCYVHANDVEGSIFRSLTSIAGH